MIGRSLFYRPVKNRGGKFGKPQKRSASEARSGNFFLAPRANRRLNATAGASISLQFAELRRPICHGNAWSAISNPTQQPGLRCAISQRAGRRARLMVRMLTEVVLPSFV